MKLKKKGQKLIDAAAAYLSAYRKKVSIEDRTIYLASTDGRLIVIVEPEYREQALRFLASLPGSGNRLDF